MIGEKRVGRRAKISWWRRAAFVAINVVARRLYDVGLRRRALDLTRLAYRLTIGG